MCRSCMCIFIGKFAFAVNSLCKSMDWFLYDNGLRYEGVKVELLVSKKICFNENKIVFGSMK